MKELKKEYKINIAYIGYNSGIYGWNFDVEKIYIIDKNNNIIEYFHLINGYRNYSSTNIKELNNLCIDNKIKEIIKKYL